jgi:hypothetical protein
MNRRDLIKGIFNFTALLPFSSLIKKKQNEYTSSDKVASTKDTEGLIIYDNQGNTTDIITFDEPLSDYDVWLAKSRHHFNCKCTLEWKRDETA